MQTLIKPGMKTFNVVSFITVNTSIIFPDTQIRNVNQPINCIYMFELLFSLIVIGCISSFLFFIVHEDIFGNTISINFYLKKKKTMDKDLEL